MDQSVVPPAPKRQQLDAALPIEIWTEILAQTHVLPSKLALVSRHFRQITRNPNVKHRMESAILDQVFTEETFGLKLCHLMRAGLLDKHILIRLLSETGTSPGVALASLEQISWVQDHFSWNRALTPQLRLAGQWICRTVFPGPALSFDDDPCKECEGSIPHTWEPRLRRSCWIRRFWPVNESLASLMNGADSLKELEQKQLLLSFYRDLATAVPPSTEDVGNVEVAFRRLNPDSDLEDEKE
ncbi:hypothetical protein HKX48_007672 [Thoreauomyces humboldtii]|nr:hypothetical protein HKX48_007672 [Thoreauomyces humboldtii]